MRISDWSSDVCSSDLLRDIAAQFVTAAGLEHRQAALGGFGGLVEIIHHGGELAEAGHRITLFLGALGEAENQQGALLDARDQLIGFLVMGVIVSDHGRRSFVPSRRSEEHTSELQSLMRISYAVCCLKN